ncbi:MAG: hypothetical protein K5866_07820 [Treponema sp.]|nr:hypothetical protein [Treponema sp.]
MTISNWIFLSLSIISIAIYIISSIKKWEIIKKISASFLMPFIAALSISFLYNELPDSRHTILTTIVTMAVATLTEILFIYEHKKIFRILFRLAFMLTVLSWMELYKSTFYIYSFSKWISIPASIIYGGGSIYILVLTGKQKIYEYIMFLTALIVGIILHFNSLIRLCYGFNLATILLFLGTSLTLAHTIFYILDYAKFHFKYGKKINFILFISAQTLITFSNVILMR